MVADDATKGEYKAQPSSDLPLLIIALSLIVFGIVLLPQKEVMQENEEIGVAVLLSVNKRVEARDVGKLVWNPAYVDLNFNEGDAIKTGSESTAVVGFFSKDSLFVDQNSLVVISLRGDPEVEGSETSLEIVSGSAEGRSYGTRMRFKTPNYTAVIEPEIDVLASDRPMRVVVQVKEDSKETSIAVVEGRGKTELGGQVVYLEEGQGFSLKETPTENTEIKVEALPEPPEPAEPLHGQIYTVGSVDDRVDVLLSVATDAAEYHFQVATDENFENIVFSTYSQEQRVTISDLSVGTYFWNVAALSNQRLHGIYAEPRVFRIVAEEKEVVEPTRQDVDLYVVKNSPGTDELVTGNVQDTDKLIEAPSNSSVTFGASGPHSPSYSLQPFSQVQVQNVIRRDDGSIRTEMVLERGQVLLSMDPERHENDEYSISNGTNDLYISVKEHLVDVPTEVLIEGTVEGGFRVLVIRGKLRPNKDMDVVGVGQEIEYDQKGKQPTVRYQKTWGVPIPTRRNVTVYNQNAMPFLTFLLPERTQNALVEASTDQRFERKVFVAKVPGDKVTVRPLKIGKYYWHYFTNNVEPSLPFDFVLAKEIDHTELFLKPIVLNDASVSVDRRYVGNLPKLVWNWRRIENAVSYRIEVFEKGQDNKPIFQSQIVRQNELEAIVDAIAEGEFRWRYFAFDYRNKLIHTSVNYMFRIQRAFAQSGLTILAPTENKLTYQTFLEVQGVVNGPTGMSQMLRINGLLTQIAPDGRFSQRVELDPQDNTIIFQYQDGRGHTLIYHRKAYRAIRAISK